VAGKALTQGAAGSASKAGQQGSSRTQEAAMLALDALHKKVLAYQ
jgi:hypothetical protein